jgi:MOSC domain-containing protein YiiM
MKLISICVGLPREVHWKGKTVTTGIFKEPIADRVQVRKLNLDGDRQADLSVHGGAEKAVYAYPAEHYNYWREELPEMELPWGMFGENLTVEGMKESEINIGDQFRIGTSLFKVTQPRMPCYKLAIKFNRDDILKRFLNSRRSGFYFSVIEEGEIGAGDQVELVSQDKHEVKVVDITNLYASKGRDKEMLRRAAMVEALPESWRDYFLQQLGDH